jgi:hypothetical protein
MVSIHFTSSRVSSIFFFQKVWKHTTIASQGLPKFERPQHPPGPTIAKRKDIRGDSISTLQEIFSFIWVFPTYTRAKEK